jgi:hypothetical protein
VSAGDFNNDGRIDLAAGNWGRNTRYQQQREQPLPLYYGDLNQDEIIELVDAYHDRELNKVVPWRDWETLSLAMPFLRERYENFTSFSTAGVEDFLGDHRSNLRRLAVNTLDSMVFLNRGDRFEARPLPVEAQVSPVFGIAVGDLDGDGHLDLLLSQNFFGVSADAARLDAGRGLWLRGDGQGGFEPVSARRSGIAIHGEGRGAALCDYDRDGRLDLAVGQNANATKLYRNRRGKPGLRIRLEGPPGNRQGVGAVVRLMGAAGFVGPAHQVAAGGGYWSQDAATLVMAAPAPPSGVRVWWPGGVTSTAVVPPGAREVAVVFP